MKHMNAKRFLGKGFFRQCGRVSSRVSVPLFALMATCMAALNKALLMDASWSGFKDSMETFFEDGLGGDGMGGVGIAIAVIGVVTAVISFVVHKFNPQSRMPGWITCLAIGLVGAMAIGGVGPWIDLLTQAQTTIFEWLGI